MSILDDIGSIFEAPADAVQSGLDMLKWIAWIFHPVNILRAVEFFTGMMLFYLGLKPYLTRQGSPTLASTGAGLQRVISNVTAPTPIGRARRVSQGRRMGTREGQREAARMEARQRVTRPQRERSAAERNEINRRARRGARDSNS